MKIGLVRRGYSPSGGAESYLKRFAGALQRVVHEVVLFASPEWPEEQRPCQHFFPVSAKTPLTFARTLSSLNPRQQCDCLFSLERVFECDIYRAGDGVHAAWLRRRAELEPFWKPIWRVCHPKHRQLLKLEESMLLHRGAVFVIANSNMVKDEIVKFYTYPEERIAVIYNGLESCEIDFDPELRDRKRLELNLKSEDTAILFAGSGWERKGLAYAIGGVEKVLAETSKRTLAPGKLTLLVAGRGKQKAYLTGKHVRFLGAVSDMKSYLAAADIFLLPTLYDPFSNACLEALGSGLPTITTSANGFSEIIRHGEEGEVLEKPWDTQGIARAILQWLDPERRREMRPKLVELAGQHRIEQNLEQTLACIQKLHQRR